MDATVSDVTSQPWCHFFAGNKLISVATLEGNDHIEVEILGVGNLWPPWRLPTTVIFILSSLASFLSSGEAKYAVNSELLPLFSLCLEHFQSRYPYGLIPYFL